MWSYEAGTLIRCRARDSFQGVCIKYAPRFAEALQDPASPSAVRLGKTLAKIGLAVDRGAIITSNQATWRSILMMEWVQFRLRSTTNVLESFHGNGNEETPRRNDFIPSVVRVATLMIRKALSRETALQNSFRVMIHTARRREKFTDAAILASEVQQYPTTLEH
jgi:hypothetical protein